MNEAMRRNTRRRCRSRPNRSGFTLIELLLVLLILVILGAVVAPNFFRQQRMALIRTAQAQITNLESALDFYRHDNDDYPTDQGLDALFNPPDGRQPYLQEKRLADPWGQPYRYQWPAQHNTSKPDIWSTGPDRQDGTEDDIVNWVTAQTR